MQFYCLPGLTSSLPRLEPQQHSGVVVQLNQAAAPDPSDEEHGLLSQELDAARGHLHKGGGGTSECKISSGSKALCHRQPQPQLFYAHTNALKPGYMCVYSWHMRVPQWATAAELATSCRGTSPAMRPLLPPSHIALFITPVPCLPPLRGPTPPPTRHPSRWILPGGKADLLRAGTGCTA